MGLFSRSGRGRRSKESAKFERSRLDGIRYKEMEVVAALQGMGADIHAPRHVMFFLHMPTEAASQVCVANLSARGHQVRTIVPEGRVRYWTCVAETRNRAIIPDFLRDTVDYCEALALEHGGEFNGWEAGLAADE